MVDSHRQSNGLLESRSKLRGVKRIVVKVGTHTLASASGRLHRPSLAKIVEQIADLHAAGYEVLLVSSGAVGMGLDALKRKVRPKNLAEMQMAAAIGQTRLMHVYQELFAKHRLLVAQILLTHDDFHDRTRNLNASTTLRGLLANGVIPIVNENDTVSVDEIRFGDNDHLAAHLSLLVDAELLVLLTTVNGVQDRSGPRAKRLKTLADIAQTNLGRNRLEKGRLSSGGMSAKLEAAGLAQENGIPVVIANGRSKNSLLSVMAGEDCGTLVLPKSSRIRGARKKWLAFSRRTKGAVVVDGGAAKALVDGNKSLLPVGVLDVEGEFSAGELVRVCTKKGEVIAKGLVNYSADDVLRLKGCRTNQIGQRIGSRQFDEIVHRDNLVLLES